MEMEKILNLSDGELVQQERQAAEQLFRLRFQMRMGQNDGVQKLRGLKKDVARIKTVVRQRQLGIVTTHATSASHEPEKAAKAKTVKAAKSQAAKPKAVKVARTASAKPATAKPTKVSGKSKAASSKAAGGKVQSNAMKGSR